ncbi:restriction endonuclease [Brevundimonas lenta]|uniref:Holliday junction resolvase n=1 Tax=Brevundimonas lenta TaxID=424796 RepID=A0A7W6JCC3_9CAUL|nr:restriction endonuclease [Brevundimonas lenta]MBB4082529.1 Holliday junction resolvase [Brevundimonas lenta]
MQDEARRVLIGFRQSLTRESLMAVLSSTAVHPTNMGEAIDLGLQLGLLQERELEEPRRPRPVEPVHGAQLRWWDGHWNPLGAHQRALRAHSRELIAYDEHRRISSSWTMAQTANLWRNADGAMFERLVARYFRQKGWDVTSVGGAGDGGIDLVMRRDAEHVIVQCKAHRRPLSPSVVRELYGALQHSGAQGAILATFDGVTRAAHNWIADKPIAVLNLRHFVKAPH